MVFLIPKYFRIIAGGVLEPVVSDLRYVFVIHSLCGGSKCFDTKAVFLYQRTAEKIVGQEGDANNRKPFKHPSGQFCGVNLICKIDEVENTLITEWIQ